MTAHDKIDFPAEGYAARSLARGLMPIAFCRTDAAAYAKVDLDRFDSLVERRSLPQPIRIGEDCIWHRPTLDEALGQKQIGYVYFIQSAVSPHIKIGFSFEPEKRLGMLQTGHPGPLVLLAKMRGTVFDENDLHIRFDEHRAFGEWFNPAPELLAYIARHRK